jgi:hypothetical protein
MVEFYKDSLKAHDSKIPINFHFLTHFARITEIKGLWSPWDKDIGKLIKHCKLMKIYIFYFRN